MSALANTFNALRRQPRVVQWIAFASIGLVVFMAWDLWIWPTTESFKSQADNLQRKVSEAATGHALVDRLDSFRDRMTAFGPVQTPQSEKTRAAAVNQAINDILKRHSLSEESLNFSQGKVPRNTLSGLVGAGRLKSLKIDFEFVATPQVVTAIIAELEAEPAIEFIRSIRLNKAPNRRLKVNLTLESWITTTGA